jgi:hypothetical protein
MTVTMEHPAFTAAHRLAPLPAEREDATILAWTRHYAGLALAAHAAFYDASETPGPELGWLSTIAGTATAAARAVSDRGMAVGGALWDLTPELGALNHEYEEWLVEVLDNLGVNPADIDPRYHAADFRSPSWPEELENPDPAVVDVLELQRRDATR